MPDFCIICGASERRPVVSYDVPDVYERAAGLPAEGYWREWVSCSNCGFHYSRYSRAGDFFDAYYARGYRSSSVVRDETAYARFKRIVSLPKSESETHTRIDWIKKVLATARDWGGRSCNLLDIGGASGVFAALFHNEQWNSVVVDPAEEGLFIKKKLGITYIAAPMEKVELETQFQLASLNYVLEHLVDPTVVLRRIRRLLSPDGMLFIEVPDVSNFETLPEEHDIFNSCHLWMFGRTSLEALLNQVGFKVCSIKVGTVKRGHRGLMLLAERAR